VDPVFPRLHVVTDTRPGRDALRVVAAAVSVAAPGELAVQVRVEDDLTDRRAHEFALAVHVALAVAADGGHVGADDLPVAAARKVLGAAGVVGATCRDADSARAAVAAGATYLGVGPAYPTSTKGGLPAPLGATGVGAVAWAVPSIPVIAIGGVTVEVVGPLRAAGAHGVAVVGALATAADPSRVTAELLKAVA
jgi:thiamine-phosphate pyrophosphorylase